jgi:hypothetical protein
MNTENNNQYELSPESKAVLMVSHFRGFWNMVPVVTDLEGMNVGKDVL